MKKKAMKQAIKRITERHCKQYADIEHLGTADLLWAINEVMAAQTLVIANLGLKDESKPEEPAE